MSKQYHIRWNDNDNKELAKAVRNFNAKINRLAKKDPKNKNALPEKISVRQLKELINTRQDLKREINTLKRFSKRGAETLEVAPNNYDNILITKWQRVETNRRLAIVNRRRANKRKELEDIELKSRGKGLGYKRGELGMGSTEFNSYQSARGFTPSMSRHEMNRKLRSLIRESQSTFYSERDLRARENYIKSLKENYDENDLKDVIDKINKMPIKDFLDVLRSEDNLFEWSYPTDDGIYQLMVEGVKSIWGLEGENSKVIISNPRNLVETPDLTNEVLNILNKTK